LPRLFGVVRAPLAASRVAVSSLGNGHGST
jgi:hypothetical protein